MRVSTGWNVIRCVRAGTTHYKIGVGNSVTHQEQLRDRPDEAVATVTVTHNHVSQVLTPAEVATMLPRKDEPRESTRLQSFCKPIRLSCTG
jgi:hypothetical protein